MITPPTVPHVHDSDRKAVAEIFNKFSVGAFSTFCVDEPDFDQAEQSELVLIIARHHAEERAEAEKLKQALEQIGTVAHCISLSGPATTKTMQDAWRKFDGISAMATKALNALRTASQSPTK